MPIIFDISQVITALTNLKNAIENPAPLLEGLGDLMVEKLQQTTPVGGNDGDRLKKAMTKKGKPVRRGRKWSIGVGDPQALGLPDTMEAGSGSDKGYISAFLAQYRAEKLEIRRSIQEEKASAIGIKRSARIKAKATKAQTINLKRQERFERRKGRKTLVGGQVVPPESSIRKAKELYHKELVGRRSEKRKQEQWDKFLKRPLVAIKRRLKWLKPSEELDFLLSKRQRYLELIEQRKFGPEFRKLYRGLTGFSKGTSGRIKRSVRLTPLVERHLPQIATDWSDIHNELISKGRTLWKTREAAVVRFEKYRKTIKKQPEVRKQFKDVVDQLQKQRNELREQWRSTFAAQLSKQEARKRYLIDVEPVFDED